jgi:hypothetical protein
MVVAYKRDRFSRLCDGADVVPGRGRARTDMAIAMYAVVFGGLLIGLGFKMFQMHEVPVPKAMAV